MLDDFLSGVFRFQDVGRTRRERAVSTSYNGRWKTEFNQGRLWSGKSQLVAYFKIDFPFILLFFLVKKLVLWLLTTDVCKSSSLAEQCEE